MNINEKTCLVMRQTLVAQAASEAKGILFLWRLNKEIL